MNEKESHILNLEKLCNRLTGKVKFDSVIGSNITDIFIFFMEPGIYTHDTFRDGNWFSNLSSNQYTKKSIAGMCLYIFSNLNGTLSQRRRDLKENLEKNLKKSSKFKPFFQKYFKCTDGIIDKLEEIDSKGKKQSDDEKTSEKIKGKIKEISDVCSILDDVINYGETLPSDKETRKKILVFDKKVIKCLTYALKQTYKLLGIENSGVKINSEENAREEVSKVISVLDNAVFKDEAVEDKITTVIQKYNAVNDITFMVDEDERFKNIEKFRKETAYNKENIDYLISIYRKIPDRIVEILNKIKNISGRNIEFNKDDFEDFLDDEIEQFKNDTRRFLNSKNIDNLIQKLKKCIGQKVDEVRNSVEKLLNEYFKNNDVSDDDKEKLKSQVKKINFSDMVSHGVERSANIWKKFDRSIVTYDDKCEEIETKITATPACDMGLFSYFKKEGRRGVSSRRQKGKHGMNIWSSSMADAKGNKLFNAIRCGNTRGNEDSTKDMILAIALQKAGSIENLVKMAGDEDNPYEIPIGNVQLMNPTLNTLEKFGADGQLPIEQIKQLEKMSDKTISVNIPYSKNSTDGKGSKELYLKIKKNPLLFNFGANPWHFDKIKRISTDLDISRKYNSKSLETLFGKDYEKIKKGGKLEFQGLVGKYLRENPGNEKLSGKGATKNQWDGIVAEFKNRVKTKGVNNKFENENNENKNELVKELSYQIIDIWNQTNGLGYKEDPYAIQSRLLVLMYYIGYGVSFNCKSGKDRTGAVSAAVAKLVHEIQSQKKVPDVVKSKKLDTKNKLEFSSAYYATATDEIAQANTGFVGTKNGHDIAKNQFGDAVGASDNAGI